MGQTGIVAVPASGMGETEIAPRGGVPEAATESARGEATR